MSNLSPAEVSHLAKLSRLELTAEEAERYASRLTDVVAYVEQLQKVATEDLRPVGVTGLLNVYAADEPREAGSPADIDSELVLAAAPKRSGNMIAVRAVLGGEVGAS